MTNLLILSIIVLTTNIFESGARTPYGGWAQWYSWNAEITYIVPTSGVYVVEAIPFIEGPIPMLSTNQEGLLKTNGWFNECWQEMNTSINVSGTYNGFYTNDSFGISTVCLPIRPFPWQFFRIKRKYDL